MNQTEGRFEMKKTLKIFGGASALVMAAAATLAFAAPAERGDRGAKMDTDGNGMVSKSEAMAAADARFTKMDADGNGQIDAVDKDAVFGEC